ncbi:MAG: porin family protein [Alkalimonas sp.]|nr:porin family protein [Alkalimonas sp.]
MRAWLLLPWLLLLSATVLYGGEAVAQDVNSAHRVGLHFLLGTGEVEEPASHTDADLSDLYGIDLFYRHQLSPGFAAEFAYINASMGIGGAIASILGGLQDINLSAVRLSGVAGYALTDRQQLFVKAGVTQNRLKLKYQDRAASKNETGVAVAAGWQYQFDEGWAVQAELGYNTSSHLTYRTGLIGLSYRF